MDSTHENASEHNPEICSRTICGTGNCTEDRAKAGNIEELDYKDFPCRNRCKVNTISLFIRRSLSRRVYIKIALDYLSIYEIACNQKQDSNKECYHYAVT